MRPPRRLASIIAATAVLSLHYGVLAAPPAAAAQVGSDSAARHPVRLRFYDAGKYGYLDATGAVVMPPQFTNTAESFSEGFARVQFGPDSSGRWTFVHTSGRLLGPARFDAAMDFWGGLAAVRIGKKWGVVDTSGAVVLEPRFDHPTAFNDNRASVEIARKVGYIDRTGTLVIPARYDNGRAFSNGIAAVKVGIRWGLIDTTGQVVLEPRFDEIFPVAPERYATRSGRESRLIDGAGRTIGPPLTSFHYLGFSEGLAAVGQGGKWGYIDTTGTLVIPAEWDVPGEFSSGRALVRKAVWNRESSRLFWGFIDRRGTLVGRFLEAQAFAEGRAAVAIDDGRWGYIDTAATVVIAPQFASVQAFSQGVANVTFPDQTWGYIDRTGRVIWRSGPGLPARPSAAAGATASTDTSALAGSGSFGDRLARLVERLETAEQRGELGVVAFGATPLLPAIVGADRRARAYADSHPDDARVAVLAARLGRLKAVAEPVVFSADNRPTIETYAAEFAPYVAFLARALTIAPTDAAAHYWMGRLYGMSFSWKRAVYGGADAPDTAGAFFRARADSALRYARRAVELAPQDVSYREALALYLVMAGRPGAAAEIVRDLAGGRHPIHVLITDWRLIPTPPGAMLDTQQTATVASMQQASGLSYAELRVRAYIVPLSAARVEAFYKTRWANLRLFAVENEDLEGTGTRAFMQFLRIKGQGAGTTLEPITTKREADRLTQSEQPTDGIMLSLIEIAQLDDATRARLRAPAGDTISMLVVVNTRRVRP